MEKTKAGDYTPEKIEEINNWRQRVEDLRQHDYVRSDGNTEEDSVVELAKLENEKRDKYLGFGATKEEAALEADKFSTERLEKLEVKNENFKDQLTGLFNRKALDEQGGKILSLELRNNKNFTVLMIDFDHFKAVNDEFGHGVGDSALQFLAKIINDNIRSSDFLFRYGGEEFVVVMADTSLSGGVILAEKIREKIEKTPLILNKLPRPLKKTISIGVCGTEQSDEWLKAISGEEKFLNFRKTIEKKPTDKLYEIIARADVALYSSKESGRNRITVYNDSLKLNRTK